MIDEDLLTQGLRETAAAYPDPQRAAEALVADLPERPSRRGQLAARLRSVPPGGLVAAVVVGVLVVGAVSIGGRDLSRDDSAPGMSTAGRDSGGDVAAEGPSDLGSDSFDGGGAAPQVGAPNAGLPEPLSYGEKPAPNAAPQSAGGRTSTGVGVGSVAGAPAVTDTKVVQTGSVDLEVDEGKVPATLTALTSLARSLQGFVADSKSAELGDAPSGVITLRVPAAQFEPALVRVRALGEVAAATSSSQDVTADFVDVSARIRALQAARARYETLLAKATNIGEVLSVQQRIDGVQQQLEQLQGRLAVISDRSSLATLTVSVHEEGSAPELSSEPNGLRRALDDAAENFTDGLSSVIAAIGSLAVVILVLTVLGLLGYGGWRIARRRTL